MAISGCSTSVPVPTIVTPSDQWLRERKPTIDPKTYGQMRKLAYPEALKLIELHNQDKRDIQVWKKAQTDKK